MSAAYPLRRTAKVRLDPGLVASLLNLPDGYQVVAVDTHNDPLGIYVIVESDDLPEVPHDVESPSAHLTLETAAVTTDAGDRNYLRVSSINIPPPPPPRHPVGFTVDCQSTEPMATCRVSCLCVRSGKPGCT